MQTEVLIIGGGATGTAIARDLGLRGVSSILIEKDHLNAGASGGNHGLLHSGARYVSNDPEAATECKEESNIIKRMMPHCVEDTGGLFIAVQGDDEKYIADFPEYCSKCGIPCESVSPQEALDLEPSISDRIIAAYRVKDASVDPFKLTLLNMSQAMTLGSKFLRRTQVESFEKKGNTILAARVRNMDTKEEYSIEAEQFINAGGAWADMICNLAGIKINVQYSKGTLLITNDRINYRVLNRLRRPSDSDILVPGGTISIIGTTSSSVEDPDIIYPTIDEVDLIVKEGAAMVPVLEHTRYIRAFCGVRPLFGKLDEGKLDDGRALSRGYALLDHSEQNVDNLTTITGGKLTTSRLMAEKSTDMVCKKMNNDKPCTTHTEPLPSTHEYEWTEPGISPRQWMHSHTLDDITVCECEMVPKSAIDEIVDNFQKNNNIPSLVDIGFRSRLGRGTCQGAFCGLRTAGYLYDRGEFVSKDGFFDMKEFFQERWKGIHSILWGDQLIQAELMEAIHCGLFGEELVKE